MGQRKLEENGTMGRNRETMRPVIPTIHEISCSDLRIIFFGTILILL
jgi:hypothetical protein